MEYLQQHYWIFIYSALLGIGTHLFWDSFTHGGGFMVRHSDFLQKTKVYFQGVRYPIWYVLQNGCSYLGLGILFVYFIKIKPTNHEISPVEWLFWVLTTLVSTAIFLLRYFIGSAMNVGNTIISLMAAILVGLLIASLMHIGRTSGYSAIFKR
jgi:hypothetical protein